MQSFKKAAENAKRAGFDGVQIQAGAGHLIDQFLRNGTNKRTDSYGGSHLNRARLLLEVVDAISTVYSTSRIGVKWAPFNAYNDMSDSDVLTLATTVIRELNKKKIGHVEIGEMFAFDATHATLKEAFFRGKQH